MAMGAIEPRGAPRVAAQRNQAGDRLVRQPEEERGKVLTELRQGAIDRVLSVCREPVEVLGAVMRVKHRAGLAGADVSGVGSGRLAEVAATNVSAWAMSMRGKLTSSRDTTKSNGVELRRAMRRPP